MSAPVSCPPALTSPEPETPSSRTGRTRPAPGRVVRDRPPDWAEVPRPRDGSHLRNVAPAARGIEGRTGDTRRQPPGYKLGARLKARPVPARSDPASPDADLLLRRRPDQCSRWQREHHPLTAGVLIQVWRRWASSPQRAVRAVPESGLPGGHAAALLRRRSWPACSRF